MAEERDVFPRARGRKLSAFREGTRPPGPARGREAAGARHPAERWCGARGFQPGSCRRCATRLWGERNGRCAGPAWRGAGGARGGGEGPGERAGGLAAGKRGRRAAEGCGCEPRRFGRAVAVGPWWRGTRQPPPATAPQEGAVGSCGWGRSTYTPARRAEVSYSCERSATSTLFCQMTLQFPRPCCTCCGAPTPSE